MGQSASVGAEIKAELSLCRMTQTELASRLGLHPSIVNLWCSGHRPVPTRHLATIEQVLGLRLGQCRAHKCALPCPACASASVRQRAVWATERRREQHRKSLQHRELAWFEDETAAIRALAGNVSAEEIAVRVNEIRATYGLVPRSVKAIETWASGNDVSLGLCSVRALNEARVLLGVSWNTMRDWRRRGWLAGKAWGKFWVYDLTELEAFVRVRPWLLTPARMAPGPLRTLAEMVSKRDPWLRVEDIARVVPCSSSMVLLCIKRGQIEAQQRTGHNGAYLLPASSVHQIRDLMAAEWQRRVERIAAYNDRRRKDRAA